MDNGVQRTLGRIEATLELVLTKISEQERTDETLEKRIHSMERKVNIAAGTVLAVTTFIGAFGQTVLRKIGL